MSDYSHTEDGRQVDFWRGLAEGFQRELEALRGEVRFHAEGRVHDRRVKGYPVSRHDLNLWKVALPDQYDRLARETCSDVTRKYDGEEYDIRL